jgi:uncharacterized membrane protein YidH (DUF202 family)
MIKKDNKEDERDFLARIRTTMANERTLMSYYRTSFAVLGIAVFIYKFYQSKASAILALIFLLISISLAVYGSRRYRRFHQRIIGKKKS